MGNKITKQKLGNIIWESANKLRGNIDAFEYKDYVLGLILYKFLCEKQTEYLLLEWVNKDELKYLDSKLDLKVDVELTKDSNINAENFQEIKSECLEKLGYFIDYSNLFNYWLEDKNNFGINKFQQAFNDFNDNINPDYELLFKDIFSKFERELDKLGSDTKKRIENILGLINTIKDIPTTKQDYDVLGFIYEYLIARFASSAGAKAGEFYTPHEVSELMSKIIAYNLKDYKENIKVYDSTSGSGSLLLNIGEEFKKYNNKTSPVKYYAQELNITTYNLTRMNLIMRGISPNEINVRCADTLKEDWPTFENNDPNRYMLLRVNAVVSNPPYSSEWNPDEHREDPRYRGYGIAPKSKADYAFLLHDLYHLDTNGIMAIVLPHGVLFRGNSEGVIRENLIKNWNIDAIIGLPSNMFYGTGIPTIIMILKKDKTSGDILFVDASQLYIKDGKNNKFTKSHVKKISDVVNNRLEVANFSRIVSLQEIEENGYNLNISRYIDNFKKQEEYDLYSMMHGGVSVEEMNKYNKFFNKFTDIKDKIFTLNNNNYYQFIKDVDIRQTIYDDTKVQNYLKSINNNLDDFTRYFKTLINSFDAIESVDLMKLEDNLTNYVFNNLNNISYVDVYDIYQIIFNNFDSITEDIKLISTIFKSYSKKSSSNDICYEILSNELTRKLEKSGSIKEWNSNILDRSLIEQTFYKNEFELIKQKQEELDDLTNQLSEVLDSISEEDKNDDIYDNEKEKWRHDEIKKIIKVLEKSEESFDEDSLEAKLISTKEIYSKIDKYKKSINESSKELIKKSYEKYLSLNKTEFYDLLITKWLDKIIDQLKQTTTNVIDNFVSQLETLNNKYDDTLEDINDQIIKNEKELVGLLKDLNLEDETSDSIAIKELIKILGGE
ncbi:type I restriction-modification system subunit M [Mycoplasma feriruminatoris]|uniref:site-specific DNA-methyltransferase (adenine-specific) n=1 Tax=Mycoplasma feriruminatoris TaxID=1179777 RepID=A0AAQ3HWX6_9MOLU|nr:type I restriction-modification system subunit M [Mycoplasma feriruminatoris]WFQ95502.1 type I restriction-modification system subunit M [Mycoplasma feriruminatoris]